jgi:hypothetical protein
MASKSTLNAKNLEALGAERLAKLLIEISIGDAAAKRRLRLALAAVEGPKEAAREIAKRLTSIAKSRTFVTWQNRKPLVKDLVTQHRAIMEQIAPLDPVEALELLWRFMGLATSIFQRCDDGSGAVIDIFHQACRDIGKVASEAEPAPEALARQAIDALLDNGFGQYDGLIEIIAPALGPSGVAYLKTLVEEVGRAPVCLPPKNEWQAVSWGSGVTLYAHEIEERARQRTVKNALKAIADVQSDVDSFIAQYDPNMRKVPKIAAGIAERLLAAGRADEALGVIDGAEVNEAGWIPREWQDARIAVLEALDRKGEAQAFRWACFERDLSIVHLRAYLKRLPDFEDIDAEERAMAHAAAHPDLLTALTCFISWPSLHHAARLLIDRPEEIDGNRYEFLAPAAEALGEKQPLAATVALRAMIDFTLYTARVKRYGHAAHHLATCADLAGRIEDFEGFESHNEYLARLRAEHGKKTGFWSRVGG